MIIFERIGRAIRTDNLSRSIDVRGHKCDPVSTAVSFTEIQNMTLFSQEPPYFQFILN